VVFLVALTGRAAAALDAGAALDRAGLAALVTGRAPALVAAVRTGALGVAADRVALAPLPALTDDLRADWPVLLARALAAGRGLGLAAALPAALPGAGLRALVPALPADG